jgi:hypothetical protein
MAGLNVLTYLTAYLDACGRNGGKPLAAPDLERFPLDRRPRRHARPSAATRPRLTPALGPATAPPPGSASRRPPACTLTGIPTTYLNVSL